MNASHLFSLRTSFFTRSGVARSGEVAVHLNGQTATSFLMAVHQNGQSATSPATQPPLFCFAPPLFTLRAFCFPYRVFSKIVSKVDRFWEPYPYQGWTKKRRVSCQSSYAVILDVVLALSSKDGFRAFTHRLEGSTDSNHSRITQVA
jgi:hypothetical protein